MDYIKGNMAMDSSRQIRRNGYHLMSLASIGQIACFGLLVWNLAWRFWNEQADEILADPAFVPWAISIAAVVVWIAQFWTLRQLRRIGKLLHSGSTISSEMADTWKRLGNGLVATALLMVLPMVPRTGGGKLDFVLRLDVASFYFVVIGTLCIYTVAHLLRLAVELRTDNESIV